jgi:hypothetical protein
VFSWLLGLVSECLEASSAINRSTVNTLGCNETRWILNADESSSVSQGLEDVVRKRFARAGSDNRIYNQWLEGPRISLEPMRVSPQLP